MNAGLIGVRNKVNKTHASLFKTNYNPWPLGQLPEKFQRPELKLVKEAGYDWKDPRDVVTMFEDKVAAFAGSKYAVAVDSCSHGLFLALKRYANLHYWDWNKENIVIPKNTYISVPMQIIHSGASSYPELEHIEWSGVYEIKPTNIWDGAVRWTKGMYVGNDAIQVVSFQHKKRVPIGRGGMILLDDKKERDWFKKMTYDGRDLNVPYDQDTFKMAGYHYYMTPEDAARGILLMDQIPEVNEDSGDWTKYPDISEAKFLL